MVKRWGRIVTFDLNVDMVDCQTSFEFFFRRAVIGAFRSSYQCCSPIGLIFRLTFVVLFNKFYFLQENVIKLPPQFSFRAAVWTVFGFFHLKNIFYVTLLIWSKILGLSWCTGTRGNSYCFHNHTWTYDAVRYCFLLLCTGTRGHNQNFRWCVSLNLTGASLSRSWWNTRVH